MADVIFLTLPFLFLLTSCLYLVLLEYRLINFRIRVRVKNRLDSTSFQDPINNNYWACNSHRVQHLGILGPYPRASLTTIWAID